MDESETRHRHTACRWDNGLSKCVKIRSHNRRPWLAQMMGEVINERPFTSVISAMLNIYAFGLSNIEYDEQVTVLTRACHNPEMAKDL